MDLAAGKPLALLSFIELATEPPTRERLSSLLWSGSPRQRARGSLRQALWQLRQVLGDDVFRTDDPVTLRPGVLQSDLRALLGHVEAGRAGQAMELWTGPPFIELAIPDEPEWERWAETMRADVEDRLATLLVEEAVAARRDGHAEQALGWLRDARTVQPDRLQHHLRLAETLLEVRAFDDAREVIASACQHFEDPAAAQELDALSHRMETLRRGAAPYPEDRARTMHLKFTGRSEEFALLARQWRQTCDGHPSTGVIRGEIGIGKTRLAQELALLVRSEGGRVVQVKAEDSERPIQWALLGEMVEQLLPLPGAAGTDPESEEVLQTVVPAMARSRGIARNTDSGRSSAMGSARPSAALADALHDLIGAVADDTPLLLIIDDLQWADPESRALLARVVRRLTDTPVFLIATARDHGSDPSNAVRKTLNVLARSPGAVELTLGPLSTDEVRTLLGRTLDAATTPQAQRIVERTIRTSRGNPLFIVELLKVLQDEGIVTEAEEGIWILHPGRVPDQLPLPHTLRELIDRQLAHLTHAAWMVAVQLSQARHPIPPRMIAARSGLDPGELTDGIGELVRRRMVYWERGDKLTFAHDELRAAVLQHHRSSVDPDSSEARSRSRIRAAAAAGLVATLGVAAGFAFGLGPPPQPSPLGGGPLLLLMAPDSAIEAVGPPNSPTGRWTFGSLGGEALDAVLPPDTQGIPDLQGLRSSGHALDRTRRLEIVPDGMGNAEARILRPDDVLVASRSWEEIHGAAWCGGVPRSLLLSVSKFGETELIHWIPRDDSLTPLTPPGPPGTLVACSPDGRFGAGVVAVEGEPGFQLVRLDADEWHPLPLEDGGIARALLWLSETPVPTPIAVEVDQERLAIAWGERSVVRAWVRYSDGTVNESDIQWRSRNPGIASVTPDGRFTANRPGHTVLLASLDGWLTDSVSVRVEEGPEVPRVLIWDPRPPAPDLWRFADSQDSSSVASGGLRAWTSAEVFSLPAGGTLELEFQSTPSSAPLQACLVPIADNHAAPRTGQGTQTGQHQTELCVGVNRNAAALDPGEMELSLRYHPSFPARRIVVSPQESNTHESWQHLGLSLLPDGTGILHLNRRELLRTPVRAPVDRTTRWLVRLQQEEVGADGDQAEPFRNLLLWSELRL